MIASSRPFWPLFLHVLGAMVLVGAMFAVLLVSLVAWHRPSVAILRRAVFRTLLLVAIPAWLVMRIDAQWIYSKEGWTGDDDPTWLGIGFLAGDAGLLILLIATGIAFWWQRTDRALPGRIVTVLASLYLVLLALAWLAMSGKWG